MSDILRLNIDKIKKGMDVVFLIKPIAVRTSREQLEKETYEIITKSL